jgi:hypothetical protein
VDDDALICDVARGECVECLADRHCSAPERCIQGLGRCAEPCTSSADCTEEPLCNPTLGACVECTVDADCNESGARCIRADCVTEDEATGEHF